MAHLETVTIGLRVITYVRGRQYRQDIQQQAKPRTVATRIVAKPKRTVCLLDADAAYALEHFNHAQPCYGEKCTHQHHLRSTIAALVKAGDLRWVGAGQNVAAWRDARELVVCRSGNMAAVQLKEVGAK